MLVMKILGGTFQEQGKSPKWVPGEYEEGQEGQHGSREEIEASTEGNEVRGMLETKL